MITKRLFLLLISFIIVQRCYAQTNKNGFCITDVTRGSSNSINNLSNQTYRTEDINNCPKYVVRVYFHFVKTNSNPGYNSTNISTIISNLNNTFSQYGINFTSSGYRDWYDEFYGSPNSPQLSLQNIFTATGANPQSNAINLYILPNNSQLSGGKANGVTSTALMVGGTRPIKFNCQTTNYEVALTRVIAHEMGHCLGLYHTFLGDGDGLADTSQDNVDDNSCVNPSNCQFVGVQQSNCNTCLVTSNPTTNMTNVMSYTVPNCMSYFSPSQLNIMKQNLAGQLNSVVDNNNSVTTIPNLLNMTYDQNSYVYTVNSVLSGWHTVYSNINPNTLSAPILWNPSFGVSGGYGNPLGTNNINYSFYLTSGQSVTFFMSVTNSCGTSNRNPTFTVQSGYRIYNSMQVQDELIIEFDNTQYLEALPQQIIIYDEKSMKTDKTILMKEVFESKQIIDNKLRINVGKLTRGNKVIHFMYPKPIIKLEGIENPSDVTNAWERKVERIILID
ncbi:MAG: hypothetical protein OHK0057_03950 [Thermoflexibacter sp.]